MTNGISLSKEKWLLLSILLKLKYTLRLFGNLNNIINKICLETWIVVEINTYLF